MTQVPGPHVMVETQRRHDGLAAGFWGCVLPVLGILFSFSAVFVPIAAVCAIFGLVRGISARDVTSIATSLLAMCLCVVGFLSSPMLLAIATLWTSSPLPQGAHSVPYSQQQRQQTETASAPSASHK